MTLFNANQLISFLTESEKISQKLDTKNSNHLVILRFPQFEEVFSLSIRSQNREIAMMPTIAFGLNSSPSMYMTYSDYALREENEDAIDSRILGLSIPINSDNLNFQMEDIFEHQYGTFLLESDKAKNAKVIEDIRSYLGNMVELLAIPLDDEETRLEVLDRMVADYVPYVRVVSNAANCNLKDEASTEVNINLVWNGIDWQAQLQNAYHPLWNLMLCRADFTTKATDILHKQKFLITLEKAASIDFWEKNLSVSINPLCAQFINLFTEFNQENKKIA